MRFIKIVLAITLFALMYSCKDATKPPDITGDVQLTAETAAPIFIRLKVDISWSGKYDAYAIQRDGNVVFTDSISKGTGGQATDVYYDGGLVPNTTYEYRALLLNATKTVHTGKAITAATTDTTTHDITWQVDTIGVFPSILRDVAAISENEAWAVGNVEIERVNHTNANLIKWNGTDYEFVNLKVKSIDGQYLFNELYDILAFNENDIWMFSGGGSYLHWNGSEFESEYIPAARGIFKASWGAAPDNFFIVGDNGSITHYDGSGFTLMESHTTVDFFDIAGVVDSQTGQTRAWALGSDNNGTVVLFYNGSEWANIWDMQHPLFPDDFTAPRAIYVPDEKSYILSVRNLFEARLYCFDQFNITKNALIGHHKDFSYGMCGSDYNDILIVGSYTSLEHFNGKSTKRFDQFYGGQRIFGVSKTNSHYFAVGLDNQLGLFYRGIR